MTENGSYVIYARLVGSTVSLCTLLNYLDPAVFEAHIVLSRPEQETYLLGHFRRPGDLTRGVRRFIANSTTTLKRLTSLGIPSGRVSVIYPPLDLETLRTGRSSTVTRSTFGVDASTPCFGILAMLLPWKGHAVFLNGAKRGFERIPKARAFVIGAAPHRTKEYEEGVRARAQELGIADLVIFTGFRPNVPDMLELLDVVVHASIAPKAFGRVITEAMAMRRPVIATGAGGPTEIIEDGSTGLLFPPRDAEALAQRIIMPLEDLSLASESRAQVTRR